MSSSRPSSSKKRSRPSGSNPFFDVLISKDVIPTKFFDIFVLRDIGVLEVTEAMMVHCGLGNFLRLNAPTHANMSVEFLSTLDYWPKNGPLERIEFSYKKKQYVLTADQLRAILGISALPSPDWDPSEVKIAHTNWWGDVTGRGFRGGQEYNYLFSHPSLRIAHKVLAMCFFGKGEVNKVSKNELAYLMTTTQECTLVPDWAGLFIESCVATRTSPKGKIAMGGMISLIVTALLDDISHLSQPGSKDPPLKGYLYDKKWLLNNKYLFYTDDGYLWKSGQDKEHVIHLPKRFVFGPAHTFRLPPDEAVDIAGPAFAAPPQPHHAHHQAEAGPSEAQQGDHEWQERLWSELGHINASVGALTQQMGRLETQLTSVQEEQARFHQYVETRFNYYTGQWEQFNSRYPPSSDQ